ncbi:MAG: GNAT family N-acetyltransferase [Bdellovibrionales bacterium]|nr:GNAT family N-acetyltransferase [Bdellovibrionales bacterium]
MIIRKAQKADLKYLCELHARSVNASARDFYTDSEIEAWACKDPRCYEKHLEEQAIFIGEDSYIRGFCIVKLKLSQLVALYVAPEHTRAGYGIALLKFCEELTVNQGSFKLLTYSSLNAVSFYKQNGFVELGLHIIRMGAVDLRCVKMSKNLTSSSLIS